MQNGFKAAMHFSAKGFAGAHSAPETLEAQGDAESTLNTKQLCTKNPTVRSARQDH